MAEVLYEIREHIAEITLNRPPVNALNMSMIEAVNAAFRRAAQNDEVRAVILTSAYQKVFCAGLDIDVIKGKAGREFKPFLDRLYIQLSEIQYKLGKPSIAAVAGSARAGGMTLAVSCDMIIAGEQASFGYPEIAVGIIPAIHFVLLPRIVGKHRAFELLFEGNPIDARRAEAFGLVNRVVDHDKVLDGARALARSLAAKAPSMVRLGRNAFYRAIALDLHRSIEDAVDSFCATVDLPEAQEGLDAFVEKRRPRW